MLEKFKQHTVLTYTSESGRIEEITEGKIVAVGLKEENMAGRVTFIDTGYLEVDCSKEYRQDLRQFDYRDIEDIWVIDNPVTQ